jgi:predicted permease
MLNFLRRLWYSLRRSRHDADLLEEIETHRALRQEALERHGASPEDAAQAARRSLGNVTLAVEDAREEWVGRAVDSVRQDVRIALRGLWKNPAFSLVAILIIGVGVGASTTVFGVINALWLRPLPFDEPQRLVWVSNGTSENLSRQSVQAGHFVDLREQSRSLAGLAAFSSFYGAGDVRLTDAAGETTRVTVVPVTQGFFPLLGVHPSLGRNFAEDEAVWGAPQTAILSHAFWKRRLGAPGDVIGRPITLDGAPVTVVGVLPESFDFAGTFSPGRPADIFRPYPLSDENNRRGNTLALVGRLRPGIGLATAAAEITATVERFSQTAPDVEPGRRRNQFRPHLSPLHDRISGRFHGTLAMLGAAAGLLMLLVSANISNLLLARAAARRKEMALRTALGAGRRRLIRQLLVESLSMSGIGAVLGLALAIGGTSLIAHMEGAGIPLLQGVRVDGLVIAFVASVAMATGVGFGVLPAFQASASTPLDALKDAGRGATGGGGGFRHAIVVSEFVLVCVLLVGAGLLTRSLGRVLDVDPGFAAENLISVRVDPSRLDRPTREARNAYFEALLQHVRSEPGVEAASLTDALPLGDNVGWRGWSLSPSERASDRTSRTTAHVRMIDDAYFRAMSIGVKAGRGFQSDDRATSEPVVIINEALARTLWPGADPLGRELRASGVNYRVIGVANDVRYFALERDTGQEMYMLLRQTGDYSTVDLVVRSAIPAASLIPSVRAALKRADPSLPAGEFRTMEQLVERSVFTRRLLARLVGGFAGFGLILASLGLYAVIAYSVNQRTREIGVRMALGAAPSAMRRQILGQTLTLAAIGLAIGLPAAWFGARAIESLLFGVVSSDPATFLGVAAVVTAVATFAGYVPARRASRIEPMLALRSE